MKAEELTVEVKAKLTVSDETAKRCLKLLEMWWDDNPDADILCDTTMQKDGISHKFRIERRNPTSVIFRTMDGKAWNDGETES